MVRGASGAGDRPAGVDREASIEALAAEVGPLALAVAQRMLGDRASAEDALQDALVQAYRALPGFRGEASPKTWFLRIVVNSCRRHRRALRRLLGSTEAARSAADRGLVRDEPRGDPGLRRRLERAVLGLPHRQRTAFVLRYGQDLGIDEIAQVMACAPGTVKATVWKAVRKLRKELADLEER